MLERENPAAANSGASKGPLNTQYGSHITPPACIQEDMYDNIPAELKVRAQWVVWKLVDLPGKAKPTKPPFTPYTGSKPTKASTTDATTWRSHGECVHAARFEQHADKRGKIAKALAQRA